MIRGCLDIYNSGIQVDGVYTIYPNSTEGIQVYCEMAKGGWTRIMNRIIGGNAFFKVLNDFKLGFGDINGNHWLGFNSINKILSTGDFMVRFEFDSSTQKYFSELDLIKIAPEDQLFKLTLGNLVNYTIRANFQGHSGQRFCTTDNCDCNNNSFNGWSGWWYANNCGGLYFCPTCGSIGNFQEYGKNKLLNFDKIKFLVKNKN